MEAGLKLSERLRVAVAFCEGDEVKLNVTKEMAHSLIRILEGWPDINASLANIRAIEQRREEQMLVIMKNLAVIAAVTPIFILAHG